MATAAEGHDADPVGVVAHETAVLIRRAESARRRVQVLDRSAYLLLDAVAARSPMPLGTLADRFQLDNSTISRQVAALEARGLLERRVDPEDGRVFRLAITQSGLAHLSSARRVRYELFAELLDGWTDAERREFGAALHRFNEEIARHELHSQPAAAGPRDQRATSGEDGA